MDFVKENENALIIKKDDIEDIVKKVERLLNEDEYRRLLAKKGAEEAKQFSWNSTINKIEKYYQEVANYVIE